jgi:phosphoribosyl-ATP pyrophosphohydrolase/phosphoribosyl-AMP cyclohydrolase
MIIPSIDISGGRTVQLVGGEREAIDAGDPTPWLERFRVAGEVAIVDIDAARGDGANAEQIARLCALAPCRVGGGIRDYETAVRWLDAGAAKIVIGTAAQPELLNRLPRARVIAALDARNGDVVTHGWRTSTGRSIESRIEELREFVGGFLITFVELEGRLGGTDLERAKRLVGVAGSARVTIAGGVTTADDVAALDRIGADAQVGMALYTGRLTLGAAVGASLTSDRPDGLIPTVVVDERGTALGLAYSSRESLEQAVTERRGVYQSRTRGRWVKGESSGATQELLRVDLDCDRDALRFTVRQRGAGFCHNGTRTCWGSDRGIAALSRDLSARLAGGGDAGSYTARLAANPVLLQAKLVEEAAELADARGNAHTTHEAADLLYFTLATLAARGVDLADVEDELARRALRVTRRSGDAKTFAAMVAR